MQLTAVAVQDGMRVRMAAAVGSPAGLAALMMLLRYECWSQALYVPRSFCCKTVCLYRLSNGCGPTGSELGAPTTIQLNLQVACISFQSRVNSVRTMLTKNALHNGLYL